MPDRNAILQGEIEAIEHARTDLIGKKQQIEQELQRLQIVIDTLKAGIEGDEQLPLPFPDENPGNTVEFPDGN